MKEKKAIRMLQLLKFLKTILAFIPPSSAEIPDDLALNSTNYPTNKD